jgi:hypothetical protein
MMGILDTLTKTSETTPPQESPPEESPPKPPSTDANINLHFYLPLTNRVREK